MMAAEELVGVVAETVGVVVDNGSDSIKAGFSGDDTPRSVFPSLIGRPKKRTVSSSCR